MLTSLWHSAITQASQWMYLVYIKYHISQQTTIQWNIFSKPFLFPMGKKNIDVTTSVCSCLLTIILLKLNEVWRFDTFNNPHLNSQLVFTLLFALRKSPGVTPTDLKAGMTACWLMSLSYHSSFKTAGNTRT